MQLISAIDFEWATGIEITSAECMSTRHVGHPRPRSQSDQYRLVKAVFLGEKSRTSDFETDLKAFMRLLSFEVLKCRMLK